MHPEDRLDALLAALRRSERVPSAHAADTRRDPSSLAGAPAEDESLLPLIEAARRLEPLRMARPDPTFAQGLQAQVLMRAAQRRLEVAATPASSGLRSAFPFRRANVSAGALRALRPALAAAAVVLALGLGLLSVAAAAPPGSPLFGLRRLEENVQLVVSAQHTDRANLYLAHAHQWLADARAAARQRDDSTYLAALRALRDDDAAAASEISRLPLSGDRTTLEAKLATLRADERATLREALPSISWSARVITTRALGDLGVSVPRVTSATVVAEGDGWRVTLAGTGFESGAVLLLNGQPAGAVIAVSDSRLVATLPSESLPSGPGTLGVGNPDGTAAAIDNAHGLFSPTPVQQDETPEPGGNDRGQPTATPGGDHSQVTPQPTSDDSQGTPTPGS